MNDGRRGNGGDSSGDKNGTSAAHADKECWACKEVGHISRNCPLLKAAQDKGVITINAAGRGRGKGGFRGKGNGRGRGNGNPPGRGGKGGNAVNQVASDPNPDTTLASDSGNGEGRA